MLSEVVTRARRRLLYNAIAVEAARAVSAGMAGLVLLLALGTGILGWRWMCLIPAAAFSAGVLVACLRRPTAYETARRIDSRLLLSDTLSTAVFFLGEGSPRRCDPGMRLAQRAHATLAAEHVDLGRALPLRIPRTIWASAGILAVLAGGLVAIRYRSNGRFAWRAPITPAIRELLSGFKTELAKLEPNLETPVTDAAPADSGNKDDAAGDPEQTSGNQAPGQADRASTGKDDKRDHRDRAETDQAGSGHDSAGSQQENDGEGTSDASSQNAASRPGGGSKQESTNQAGGQSGANEWSSRPSLLSSLGNAAKSLVSALMPRSGGAQGAQRGRTSQSGTGTPQREHGNRHGEGAQGSPSQGTDQADGTAEGVHGGIRAGENSGPPSESNPANGAGSQDGRKEIRSADELAAMGKLNAILGKRANDLTGTASIEVTSGHQDLKTPYAARNAEHRDAQAGVNRDQVPLVLRDYIEQYFRELRQPGPLTHAAKPRAAPGAPSAK